MMRDKLYCWFFLVFVVTALTVSCSGTGMDNTPNRWVATWATSPQPLDVEKMPEAFDTASTGSIRQIVRTSIGGNRIRLQLSNHFSDKELVVLNVSIAHVQKDSVVDGSSLHTVSFKESEGLTIAPFGEVFSDPLAFNLLPDARVAITIHLAKPQSFLTGHSGSRTTSFIKGGNHVNTKDFTNAEKKDHWYIINSIEVTATDARAIAVLGNSITDGRGSGTNKQNRWTDVLSERLLDNTDTENVSVLNFGIGGNTILRGGLGPTALERFDRDILSRQHVQWLLILQGINDIGAIPNEEAVNPIVQEIIDAYTNMIGKAHAQGIKVYGCTILPFEGSFYDAPFRQTARDKVNEWIRSSGQFDAVIDFDAAMRQQDLPKKIKDNLHDADWLHPNEEGYDVMGKYVDLGLFVN